MIHDLDETLRRLLAGELAKVPGCPVTEPAQITFDPPTVAEEAKASGCRVNLYLHDVRENLALRDESFQLVRRGGDSTVGIKRPPVRLDLAYIVTTHCAEDAAQEHRLLSDVLSVLLRFPAAPQQYLAGTLEGAEANAVPISVAQPDHPAHLDPPRLWQALGGRLRPAICVVATVPFDPFETKFTKVVREAIIGMGLGVPPHGPRRPLELSSTRVSVAGVIVDHNTETPLPGAVVTLEGRDESATADERGFFYILNLPSGSCTVRARRRGYAAAERAVIVPPPGRPDLLEPQVIGLQPLDDDAWIKEEVARVEEAANDPAIVEGGRAYHVSLSGRLRHADGRPAAYIRVRVGEQCTVTDNEGYYSFVNLPPGDHTIVTDLSGDKEKSAPAPPAKRGK